MKLSCLQENLARGLGIVGRAVATRSTLPITGHVLIASDGGRLKLSATNLEIALTCWIGAQIEEEGAITIPARLLTDFVSSLPPERIDVTLPARSRQLRLVCARNEATIGGMDADDFPPIPRVEGGEGFALDPKALHTAITQVVFAAATDDSRPVLTGVHTLMEGADLTLAAADGFRLSVHHLPLGQSVAERTEVIIPARALAEVNRLLADEDEPVQMMLNANRTQALFRLKNVEMVAQLIQGTFPNYSQLIPSGHTSKATVSVADFLRETRIASIFARDGSGIVRLVMTPGEELTPGKIAISARAEEIGDNMGEIDAVIEGEEAKIAFNGKYLQDVLAVLEDGQVALETTNPSSPGVLRPVGVENYVHVIMPMFVQW
ncbi:MAG TPA: DNA polymerase III subunit beta [Dehalococcoidia bacterium]|nr:DNA polymerase III subunit beta [Dehalococcoidia bacterium]